VKRRAWSFEHKLFAITLKQARWDISLDDLLSLFMEKFGTEVSEATVRDWLRPNNVLKVKVQAQECVGTSGHSMADLRAKAKAKTCSNCRSRGIECTTHRSDNATCPYYSFSSAKKKVAPKGNDKLSKTTTMCEDCGEKSANYGVNNGEGIWLGKKYCHGCNVKGAFLHFVASLPFLSPSVHCFIPLPFLPFLHCLPFLHFRSVLPSCLPFIPPFLPSFFPFVPPVLP
jgi:hypothetical protein